MSERPPIPSAKPPVPPSGVPSRGSSGGSSGKKFNIGNLKDQPIYLVGIFLILAFGLSMVAVEENYIEFTKSFLIDASFMSVIALLTTVFTVRFYKNTEILDQVNEYITFFSLFGIFITVFVLLPYTLYVKDILPVDILYNISRILLYRLKIGQIEYGIMPVMILLTQIVSLAVYKKIWKASENKFIIKTLAKSGTKKFFTSYEAWILSVVMLIIFYVAVSVIIESLLGVKVEPFKQVYKTLNSIFKANGFETI